MKHISIVTPCYNEEENIKLIYDRVKSIFDSIDSYTYEHIFIDNDSIDKSQEILRQLAGLDPNVKLIFNCRNYGHVRSPYYGLLQGRGDAAILLVCDLQDPPELIPLLIKKWESGHKVVVAVKNSSDERSIMFFIRLTYYRLVNKLADIQLIDNFTGFGIYDQSILNILRKLDDPYPYFRGLISDVGGTIERIVFNQPVRKKGVSKNNFYALYDMAMLGIISHSKVPLRVATMGGFLLSFISLVIGLFYLMFKLLFWESFSLGIAPVLVGLFFFGSIQLFFIGMLGEYLGAVYTQTLKRPLVIERERINFDKV